MCVKVLGNCWSNTILAGESLDEVSIGVSGVSGLSKADDPSPVWVVPIYSVDGVNRTKIRTILRRRENYLLSVPDGL